MSKILLVEDEPLIAMMVEGWLQDMGHETVGPAGSVDGALALIADGMPDAAILDLRLDGEDSLPVAAALADKNVPFAFASGDTGLEDAERFTNISRVSKPYTFEAVGKLLDGLLGRA